MKTAVLTTLKIAISLALMWMILREHHFTAEILPHLSAMVTNWHWTLAGLTSVGVSTGLGAFRWGLLLRGQKQNVSAESVLRVMVVSNFFNITSLGAAGGDAYRVVGMLKQPGTARLPVVVSVVLDHMVGTAGTAILFLCCSLAFQEHWDSYAPEMRALVHGFTIFMSVSLGGMIVCVILFAPQLYNWGEKWLPMLRWRPLKQFSQACDGLRRSWGFSLIALVTSLGIFFFHFLSFYCGIYAVGAETKLLNIMAAMPIVDAAAGLPISVSGLGVREKTFETLMHGLSGLAPAVAISASLAGWLMGVAWGLLGGLLFIKGGPKPTATPAESAAEI